MSEKQTSTDEKTYTLEELAGEANGQEPVVRHKGIVLRDGRFVSDCGKVWPNGDSILGRPTIKCSGCFPKT